VNGIGFEFGSSMLIEKTSSNINLSYSYLEMENVNFEAPLLYRPKHRIRFTVVQDFPLATFQFSSRYTSRQFYEDFLSDEHPIENQTVIFPIEKLPQTIINDLGVSTKMMNFDFSFKIKNIFNTNYVLIQHYPMPGRNFELNVNKTID
jgi:iron complex outermembrane receptor protein